MTVIPNNIVLKQENSPCFIIQSSRNQPNVMSPRASTTLVSEAASSPFKHFNVCLFLRNVVNRGLNALLSIDPDRFRATAHHVMRAPALESGNRNGEQF